MEDEILEIEEVLPVLPSPSVEDPETTSEDLEDVPVVSPCITNDEILDLLKEILTEKKEPSGEECAVILNEVDYTQHIYDLLLDGSISTVDKTEEVLFCEKPINEYNTIEGLTLTLVILVFGFIVSSFIKNNVFRLG